MVVAAGATHSRTSSTLSGSAHAGTVSKLTAAGCFDVRQTAVRVTDMLAGGAECAVEVRIHNAGLHHCLLLRVLLVLLSVSSEAPDFDL